LAFLGFWVFGSYFLPSFPDPKDLPKIFRDYINIDMEPLKNDVNNLD
jgi:hypothetical protein